MKMANSLLSNNPPLKRVRFNELQLTKEKFQFFSQTDYRYIDLSDESIVSSSTDQYNTGTSFTSRVLKANVLAPGSKYKFIINVNDGSKIGSSNVIVEVRNGPTSGSFAAEPTSLEQLQEVTLRGR